LVLLERAPGVSVEEIQSRTEPKLATTGAVPEMTF
jgi:acyl CoA:acetate/3-ketoacid CoA transferase beta subunit